MESFARFVSWTAMAAGWIAARRWLSAAFGDTTRKTLLALLAQAIVSGANFLTTVLIGRFCGLTELGLYSLAFAILLALAVVQEALIWSPYTVFCSRLKGDDKAAYAGHALGLQGLSTGCGLALLVAVAAILSYGLGPPGLAPVVWALAGMMPFFLLRQFVRRLWLADLAVGRVVRLDLAATGLQFGGFLLLIWAGKFSAAAASIVVGLAAAAPVLVWALQTDLSFSWRWSRLVPEVRRHWSFGRWICASQLTDIGQKYALHWLLAAVASAAATGLYAACTSVVILFNPILLGTGSVLIPLAARAHHHGGNREARRLVWRTSMVLSGTMLLLCGFLWVAGDPLVRLLYRGETGQSHQLLISLLSLAFLAHAISFASDIGLWVIERPDLNFKAGFVGLTVSLAVAAVLVGQWDVLGAALGGLAGSMVTCATKVTAFARLTRSDVRAGGQP
jgi:O-antigen/teichoic acid export membrane protein